MSRFYSSAAWRRAREEVLTRDGHRCTAEELDGSRCEETTSLHVDHTVELWVLLATRRDPADVDYLQTLCASHHAQLGALRRRQAPAFDGYLAPLAA